MNFEASVEEYKGTKKRYCNDGMETTYWIKVKLYKPHNSIRMEDRVMLKNTADSYEILLFVLTPLLTGEFLHDV